MPAALRVPLAHWKRGCALFLLHAIKQTPVSLFRSLSSQGGPQHSWRAPGIPPTPPGCPSGAPSVPPQAEGDFLRQTLPFGAFNGISGVIPASPGEGCAPLTASVRCVGVGADQQRDVELLCRVGDDEDDLRESEETAMGVPFP